MQSIVGALLLYGRAINNNLLIALSKLEQKQAAATQATNDTIMQLLDYVANYPSGGITFRASDTVLVSHSESAYLNVSKVCSCASAHIMISEDVPVPSYNSPVITITHITKHVMSSATEAKLAGLFVCAK